MRQSTVLLPSTRLPVESLIAEFDGAKSDGSLALRRRWMPLPKNWRHRRQIGFANACRECVASQVAAVIKLAAPQRGLHSLVECTEYTLGRLQIVPDPRLENSARTGWMKSCSPTSVLVPEEFASIAENGSTLSQSRTLGSPCDKAIATWRG